MPAKKNKFNARFPPSRVKKIMQNDEEIGKVAANVPAIVARSLELFAEALIKKSNEVTMERGARTLTPSHVKLCIEKESRFDFLKATVSSVPDLFGDREDGSRPQLATPQKSEAKRAKVADDALTQKQNDEAGSKTKKENDELVSTPKPTSKMTQKKKKKEDGKESDETASKPKQVRQKKLSSMKKSPKKPRGRRAGVKLKKIGTKMAAEHEADVKLEIPDSGSNDLTELNTSASQPEVPTITVPEEAIKDEDQQENLSSWKDKPVNPFILKDQTSSNLKQTELSQLESTKESSTAPLQKIHRSNHIPFHLVSATAIATFRPIKYGLRTKLPKKRDSTKSNGSSTFPFSNVIYPAPASLAAQVDPKDIAIHGSNIAESMHDDKPISQQWPSHIGIDEDYDA